MFTFGLESTVSCGMQQSRVLGIISHSETVHRYWSSPGRAHLLPIFAATTTTVTVYATCYHFKVSQHVQRKQRTSSHQNARLTGSLRLARFDWFASTGSGSEAALQEGSSSSYMRLDAAPLSVSFFEALLPLPFATERRSASPSVFTVEMRLINTSTYELKFFMSSKRPAYAILSHCWGDDEVTLQEYERCTDKTGPRFSKIRDCCSLAAQAGIGWAWVDTNCVDKTSSAELSEAINSMYKWYECSAVCYVFLEDDPEDGDLSKCRWFTRGWTLQELLAPSNVQFYGRGLTRLGDKHVLSKQIEDITRIPHAFLVGHHERPVHSASISLRMSWASERETTREEDVAYCLLGIFDINMPLLYGEGSKAFMRLQEGILARSDDESIFCWARLYDCGNQKFQESSGLLALSPQDFRHSGDISPAPFSPPRPPYVLTNKGLRFHVSRTSIPQWLSSWRSTRRELDLQCVDKDGDGVAIELRDDGHTLHRSPDVMPGRNLYPRGFIETLAMGGYSERLISLQPYRTPRHLSKATIDLTFVDAILLIPSCLSLLALIKSASTIISLACIVGITVLRVKSGGLWLGQYLLIASPIVTFLLACFYSVAPFAFWTCTISWMFAGLVLLGLVRASLATNQLHVKKKSAIILEQRSHAKLELQSANTLKQHSPAKRELQSANILEQHSPAKLELQSANILEQHSPEELQLVLLDLVRSSLASNQLHVEEKSANILKQNKWTIAVRLQDRVVLQMRHLTFLLLLCVALTAPWDMAWWPVTPYYLPENVSTDATEVLCTFMQTLIVATIFMSIVVIHDEDSDPARSAHWGWPTLQKAWLVRLFFPFNSLSFYLTDRGWSLDLMTGEV